MTAGAAEYRDKGWFAEEFAKAGDNCAEMARRTGYAYRTIATWAIRHELKEHGERSLPPGSGHPKLVATPRQDPIGLSDANEATVLAELQRRHEPATLISLADSLDIAPRRVLEAVDGLFLRGFSVPAAHEIESGEPVMLESNIRPLSQHAGVDHRMHFAGEVVEFSVCSDTHLGDRHCRLDALHAAYEKISEMGISKVFHPGDLTHGIGIYRGQRRSLLVHTFEDMVDYTAENYPDGEPLGIETLVIAGNHDIEGDFGQAGANPVKAVANMRPDIKYLGDYSAHIEVHPGIKVHMLHPMGGGSYAKSYKPQKHAEGYSSGTKPALTLFGHWHNMEMGLHRGIYMLNCGAFEGESDLAVRLGLGQPVIGFWTVRMRIGTYENEEGHVRPMVCEFQPTWRAFFNGQWVAVEPG